MLFWRSSSSGRGLQGVIKNLHIEKSVQMSQVLWMVDRMNTNPPNILLIMADQLAAPALPSYGHPIVQAPYLTQLAETGVQFNNAYCNSPLCAPSRFSMMSGQLPSRIGAYDNAACFPADVPTMAHYLRVLGYRTCLSGKMHFVGPDQLHGFEERLTTDVYPSDFGWTPDWENFAERPTWYHNMLSVVQAGTCQTSNQLDFDEEVAFQTRRKLSELARSDDERPFFLVASFTHPHDPFAITPEYWNRYDHAAIDLPTVSPIPFNDLDPHSQRIHHVCAMNDYTQTNERVRKARHAYYGMISYIDDKVGELLAILDAMDLRDKTIVIFTSDHGEMLGERGLWYKMSFFEWSARVPLIFHAPKHFPARRIDDPVSLLDILPTLVDLASGNRMYKYPVPIDGHSLLPWLEGTNQEPHTVYGELLGETAIAPLLMIRGGRYKYVYSKPDPEQLYDLENDPNEQKNLAIDPNFRSLCQEFHTELMKQWQPNAIHQQVLHSQRRRRLVDQALRQGAYQPWDYQAIQDASQMYMRNHLDLNVLERTARFPSPDIPPTDGDMIE